ncbi:WG repeat-containing protein [Paenibacillus odorifer]|nr:WG repeat-containing protein [Paenibacillus odorifer]
MKKLFSIMLCTVMFLGIMPIAKAATFQAYAIEPQYDYASDFHEGLAGVERDGKWGFIDKTGKEVIAPQYDYARSFNEGLADVRKDGKYGFIDKTGKEVIVPKYDNVHSFSEGLATVIKGGKYGFIDKTGREVIASQYYEADNFSEGLARIETEDGKHGFIDKTGKEVIAPKYDDADSFSEGLARVVKTEYGEEGFIDKTGKEVIAPKYEIVNSFSEGLAMVRKNGKFGFIDKTGKEVIAPKYDSAYSFSEGLARVGTLDGKTGFIDPAKDYRYGYIDKTGKEVIALQYVNSPAELFSEGLAAVYEDGRSRFIDKTGKEVIALQYDNAPNFSEGLAAVEKDGKWGFIANPLTAPTPTAIEKEIYLKVDSQSLNLVENDSKAIHVTTKTDGATISYSSSDPWIANVSSEGTVTARRPGTAIISIKASKDGYTDAYSTVYVTVTGLKDFNLLLEPGVLIMKQGESKRIISNLPDQAKVSSIVSQPDVADIEMNGLTGIIHAKKLGETLVTFNANMDGYKDGNASATVIVTGDIADINSTVSSWAARLNTIPAQDKNTRNVKEAVTSEAEDVIASLVKRKLDSTNGSYIIDKALVSLMSDDAAKVKSAVDKQLSLSGITLDRGIDISLTLDADSQNEDGSITIKLDKDAFSGIQDIDTLYVQLYPLHTAIGIDLNTINTLFDKSKSIQVIVKKDKEAYKIKFVDENGNEIAQLSKNITLVLPVDNGNPHLGSVFLQEGASITQVGGSYDAYNQGVSIKTKKSGSYYVAQNSKKFKDMSDKDEELNKAVDFLTAKGIVTGVTKDTFEPDSPLTRSQFVTMLVKSFYALDKSLTADFKDVKKADWFHDYVASSQKEKIVVGMADGTFRPNDLITKEQMAAVVSRAMVNKRKYEYPQNDMEYLAFIKDRDNVSEWAKKEVALAIKERMLEISSDSQLNPQSIVTRGEAARTLYRLFLKLY